MRYEIKYSAITPARDRCADNDVVYSSLWCRRLRQLRALLQGRSESTWRATCRTSRRCTSCKGPSRKRRCTCRGECCSSTERFVKLENADSSGYVSAVGLEGNAGAHDKVDAVNVADEVVDVVVTEGCRDDIAALFPRSKLAGVGVRRAGELEHHAGGFAGLEHEELVLSVELLAYRVLALERGINEKQLAYYQTAPRRPRIYARAREYGHGAAQRTAIKRNALPKKIVWRQEEVMRPFMYWLGVDLETARPGMAVVAELSGNEIKIEACDYPKLRIYLNDRMVAAKHFAYILSSTRLPQYPPDPSNAPFLSRYVFMYNAVLPVAKNPSLALSLQPTYSDRKLHHTPPSRS